MPRSEKPPGEGGLSEVSGAGTPNIVPHLQEALGAARRLSAEVIAEADDPSLAGDLAAEVYRLVVAVADALASEDDDAAGKILATALGSADRHLRARRELLADWVASGWISAADADRIERGGVEPPPVATERLP
jgi:hypothetical protein